MNRTSPIICVESHPYYHNKKSGKIININNKDEILDNLMMELHYNLFYTMNDKRFYKK